MQKFILYLFLLGAIALNAQKNIYENPHFDELSDDHRVLAILPFLTNLDLKDNASEGDIQSLEEKEGYAVQDAFETYFSKRKKKKKFPVNFQNIKDTKAILAQNKIDYNNIDVYTTKQLSEILGVDGIISGTLDLNVLLSKGVSTDFDITDYFSGDANYGRIGVKISDGDTGKLLWKYEKEINKKTGKNTDDLIDRMMRLAIRKFPYERERKKDRKD
ncbi:hypothetical protein [Maribacter cobaltidurans]|uniref:Uncharacterized protein n=1 Tax=Maribacter cobaltidurans TaxID=1178778 RepID=A0A223V0T5_9FLAO|nr:hypothetical protein [Maribacter cobaltidurans]ASV28944.1 hypothetical protein CJ263_01125 [Maribacter cobaltidurans]GGD73459.1 hypothetical protein GCM10011412_08920 [Maribacter cobaltidurans]